MARGWACMVPALFLLVASPIDFFFSRSSISRKIDAANFLGPFDVRKVPESQKDAKKTRKSASQC
jgi:hypothetical protein